MQLIADDPIIRCIERTGYPPWYFPRWNWNDDDYEREEEEEDHDKDID